MSQTSSQTSLHPPRSTPAGGTLDVELRKVFKVFDGETAVRGVDLDVRRGEFFSILGPSGCGKTTTLRLVAGFETPSAGEVMVRGQSMRNTPPYQRPVNTVFQSYALFSHMSVWDNVAFGLRIKRQGAAEVQERVREALKLVQMESFAQRYPRQLSGGQQQRVALARALANRPAVLLLDEPLGALDLKLRKEMQVELSNLHQDLGLTFITVTHDQEEALSLSDRIAVMNEGRIEQVGTPREIYETPKTAFVADFIGDTNLFRGRMTGGDRAALQVTTDRGMKLAVQPPEPWSGPAGDPLFVSVRPEKIRVTPRCPDGAPNCFEGHLRHVMYLGTHVHYVVELRSGDRLVALQLNAGGDPLELHASVFASWSPSDCLAVAA